MKRVVVVLSLLLFPLEIPAAVVEPSDCPTIFDSAGRRLGLVLDTGGIHTWAGGRLFETGPATATIAKVALAVDGRPFVFTVTRSSLQGTLEIGWVQSLYYTTPDCTGAAWIGAGPDADPDLGPLPLSVVWGPARTLYELPPGTPWSPQSIRSLGQRDDFTGAEWCYVYPSAHTYAVSPLTAVVDLAPEFVPPYHVEDGPCPWPGARGHGRP